MNDKAAGEQKTLILEPAARKHRIELGPMSVVGKFKTRDLIVGRRAIHAWREFGERKKGDVGA